MKKEFALKIFEAFSIERWNDLIRPFSVVEMDRAAERMVIAYIIGKYEENRGATVDWEWMIYASVFDLLRKIALCDIKSPVQKIIRQEYPGEYVKLNRWVLEQYRPYIDDEDFFQRFENYLKKDLSPYSNFSQSVTQRIFKAANKYSSLRELEMIRKVNEPERVDGIFRQLNEELQHYLDLRGLQLFMTKQKPFDFLLRIEQLRFQTRWNQTPRVPLTSVLGHCYFVAVMSLIFSRECGQEMPRRRIYNNFFCGLFHDLPESVTRDIISPVKMATAGLPAIVKDIEDRIVTKELLPLMEDFYKDEILYYTNDEFDNKICLGRRPMTVGFDELNGKYNRDEYNPVDGKLVRLADHYSALLESDSSIRYGITSSHLASGRDNLVNKFQPGDRVNGIDAYALFSAFRD